MAAAGTPPKVIFIAVACKLLVYTQAVICIQKTLQSSLGALFSPSPATRYMKHPVNTSALALGCRQGASTPSTPIDIQCHYLLVALEEAGKAVINLKIFGQ
jgi:hypothetical protein